MRQLTLTIQCLLSMAAVLTGPYDEILAYEPQPPGSSASDENALPQLQNNTPPARRPGSTGNNAAAPDFLRGLQLADTGPRRGRQSFQSLLAPAQFHGNIFGSSGQVVQLRGQNQGTGLPGEKFSADLITAGGNSAFSISDNNKPVPQNRYFFDYRHYNNAFGTQSTGVAGGSTIRRQNFDGFLFGLEKTFGEAENTSLEVRIPFAGNAGINASGFGIGGNQFGNIPVVWKQTILIEQSYSVVAGSALITPTGGDSTGHFNGLPFRVRNQAWHIAPFIGAMLLPDAGGVTDEYDSLFPSSVAGALSKTTFQFFGQVNVPLNDQGVAVPGVLPGGFREATFLSLDPGAVYNFFDHPNAEAITRLDGSVELHYTRNLGGGSDYAADVPFRQPLMFTSSRITDLLNMSAGFSMELNHKTRIQVAAVVPFFTADAINRRAFDSEFIFSINRFY